MKILIAGDFCPYARGQRLVDSGEFSDNFVGIPKLTKESDFSIVNFETNISTPNSRPIEKAGPCLTTDERSLTLIKYLGFNIVTLANNHFFDYGQDAVENTIKCLDSSGIKHVGGGNTINEAKEILYVEKNGESLAIINACEHEFSIVNGIHGGSYGIDPIQIFYDIQEAKKKANYILVITHGGHEYFQLPSLRMKEWFHFFVNAGADAVVNHHQHCYSGMEVYKGKPIYYGLGNFFFDKQDQKEKTSWNEGILVELNFTKDHVSHQPIPFEQCIDKASVSLKINDSEFYKKFYGLSEIIINNHLLKSKIREFYLHRKRNFLSYFQPYIGRILVGAYRHKLLPSLLPKRRFLSILNIIECEAHHDLLKYIFHDNYHNNIADNFF